MKKEKTNLFLFLDDRKKLLLKSTPSNYDVIELTYKNGKNKIFLGTFNSGEKGPVEWMDYNSDYVVIMHAVFGYKTNPYKYEEPEYDLIGEEVKTLFSVKEERIITGTKEELYTMYEEIFKGIKRKKSLNN